MPRFGLAWHGLVLLASCAPELGECDPAEAIRVAYDANDGAPAYEGQAMMVRSCGGGRFCHAGDGIDTRDRYGVPLGLTFDVSLAGADGTVDPARIARQRRARFVVVQQARAILHTIDLGTMPPGEQGRLVVESASPYLRSADATFVEMPAVGTPEGREIVRNWLACGAPVVERPVAREDGVRAVVVPGISVDPVEPTWDGIYRTLLLRRCATVLCHGGDPDAGLRVTADEGAAHAALLETASGSACAGGGRIVVPGDPNASLLVRKLEAGPVCGDRMPALSLPLNDADLEAVRAWIAMGAPGP